MSLVLKILLGVDALLLMVLVIYVVVRLTKEKGGETVEPIKEIVKEPLDIKQDQTIKNVEPLKAEEPIKQEIIKPQEIAIADDQDDAELIIGDLEDPADDRELVKRVSFAEKMLTTADEKTKEYYNALYNKFISYRKVNPRVSSKCLSVRFGKELIAKISVRGKTMKLHLALNCKDFDENIYFQKDMTDVKAYEEVPFTVKVKSDRGLKNAYKLIEAVAEKKSIEQKQRFTPVDALSELAEF
ncbi:MAG: hypothetical protein E7346_01825 [Clostridiales bacterium]|nr:hypothetical protein [Clostridiales bacterium]